MIKLLKKFLGKENTSPNELPGSPLDIIILCMKDISQQLLAHFNNECYKWNEATGVKALECLILSKFFIDHSLMITFHHKLEEPRLKFYLQMIESVFSTLLKLTFAKDQTFDIDNFQETIKNRLVLYSSVMAEQPHPRCWQIIAGICTGTDYYNQKDLEPLLSSSSVLPFLMCIAQGSLKSFIKP